MTPATAVSQHVRLKVLHAAKGSRLNALRPDLILGTNAFELEDKAVYDRLSRMAPTVHFVEGSLVDSWQEAMHRVGRALGQEDALASSWPQPNTTWRACESARPNSRARR